MPKYENFEDLPVWQEAASLYNKVLDLLETPQLPLSSPFRNQLERAALSVSNNIAEGFERETTAELLPFWQSPADQPEKCDPCFPWSPPVPG